MNLYKTMIQLLLRLQRHSAFLFKMLLLVLASSASTVLAATLGVSLTATPSVDAGNFVELTTTVTNGTGTGASTTGASGLTLTFTLPAGLNAPRTNVLAASEPRERMAIIQETYNGTPTTQNQTNPTRFRCEANTPVGSTQTLTCTINGGAGIAAGNSATFKIYVQSRATPLGAQIINVATNGTGGDAVNRTASATTTLTTPLPSCAAAGCTLIGSNLIAASTGGTFGTASSTVPGTSAGADTNVAGYTYTAYNSAIYAPQDGQYTVVNSTAPSYGIAFNTADSNTFLWHQISDHTKGDPSGNMLIINSINTPNVFYRTTVSGLAQNTMYDFSAWAIALVSTATNNAPNGSKAQFEVSYDNGTNWTLLASTPDFANTNTPVWKNFSATLNTLSNTSVQIRVRNATTAAGPQGNDLALDDLGLFEVNYSGDLSVTKTDNQTSRTPGQTTSYTVVVSNAGPGTATGALFKDPAAANLTVTGVTCGNATGGAFCPPASPSALTTSIANMQGAGVPIPSLPAGGSVTFTVNATVATSAIVTSVANTAAVTAPLNFTDTNPGNNSATDTTTVVQPTCIASGFSTVGNATVQPSGVIELTPDAKQQKGAAWSNTRADLDQAFDYTAKVYLGVNDTGADGITFTLQNQGPTAIGIAGRSLAAGFDTNGNGAITPSLTIELDTYQNTDGSSPRIWADPSGDHMAAYLNGDSTHRSNTDRLVTATVVPNLEDGQYHDFRVTWNPTTNTLQYYLDSTLYGTINRDIRNDVGKTPFWGYTASTGDATNQQVFCNQSLLPAAVADLSITKTDGQSSYLPNQVLNYTIVIANAGPATATNAVFRDPSVTNLTVTSVTCGSVTGSGVCPPAGTAAGQMSIANMQSAGGILIPTLPKNSSVTFTVTATVSAGATGNIANIATITLPTGFTDPTANNSATDTDTPSTADLSINNTGPSSVVLGSPAAYTIKVWNQGPSVISGATIADSVPANLTTVTWTCAASGTATCGTASGSGNAISFASGLLPVNASPTPPTSGDYLTITVTGTASTIGSPTNTATVTAPTGSTDPVSGNNTSSQQTFITPLPTCDTLYGISALTNSILVVNPATGAATAIGSTSAQSTALAIQPGTNKLYYFTISSLIETRVWDSATNTSTLLPNSFLTTAPGDQVLRAAFSPTGRLFVTTDNPGTGTITQLIEVDPATGALISRNPISALPASTGDLVFDGNGTLFITAENRVYTINLTTYVATLVSTTPSGTNFVGLAFTADGTLYGATGGPSFRLFTINPSTGATTLRGLTNQNLGDLGSCAFPVSALASSKTVTKVAGSVGSTVLPGDTLEYTITTTNSGTVPAVNTTLQDSIPAGTTYVAGSTKLNTVAVTDGAGGVFPYATAAEIRGVGMNSGVIGTDTANETATVVFRVTVTALSGNVSNQGTVTATGVPPVLTDDPTKPGTTDPTVTPVGVVAVVQPAITLEKFVRNVTDGTSFVKTNVTAKPKDIIEYCIAYINAGGLAANFSLTDNVPAGMQLLPDALVTLPYVVGSGIHWSTTSTTVTGNTTPTGTNLTNASDLDQGTLTGVGTGTHNAGLLTLNLGLTGLANGGRGTVCFQTQVP
ncbi:lectin-like domain-containing protein [Deinococcus puniceus]|uniref:DUF11 domain-containing protein n=1 Tax=Deinococcus puniceus TaxID=1182568 RepID=A0A172T726_9DEIO|nr:DUF11 domain-containing protein [Deinococcus puniceus]ANE42757.1 hypothetical protein SU48_02150 [Deinococcus puniceus]